MGYLTSSQKSDKVVDTLSPETKDVEYKLSRQIRDPSPSAHKFSTQSSKSYRVAEENGEVDENSASSNDDFDRDEEETMEVDDHEIFDWDRSDENSHNYQESEAKWQLPSVAVEEEDECGECDGDGNGEEDILDRVRAGALNSFAEHVEC